MSKSVCLAKFPFPYKSGEENDGHHVLSYKWWMYNEGINIKFHIFLTSATDAGTWFMRWLLLLPEKSGTLWVGGRNSCSQYKSKILCIPIVVTMEVAFASFIGVPSPLGSRIVTCAQLTMPRRHIG